MTDLTRLLVKESTSFDRLLRQLEIHVVRIDQACLDGETRHQNAEHDLLGRGTEHRTGVVSENGQRLKKAAGPTVVKLLPLLQNAHGSSCRRHRNEEAIVDAIAHATRLKVLLGERL